MVTSRNSIYYPPIPMPTYPGVFDPGARTARTIQITPPPRAVSLDAEFIRGARVAIEHLWDHPETYTTVEDALQAILGAEALKQYSPPIPSASTTSTTKEQE